MTPTALSAMPCWRRVGCCVGGGGLSSPAGATACLPFPALVTWCPSGPLRHPSAVTLPCPLRTLSRSTDRQAPGGGACRERVCAASVLTSPGGFLVGGHPGACQEGGRAGRGHSVHKWSLAGSEAACGSRFPPSLFRWVSRLQGVHTGEGATERKPTRPAPPRPWGPVLSRPPSRVPRTAVQPGPAPPKHAQTSVWGGVRLGGVLVTCRVSGRLSFIRTTAKGHRVGHRR